MANLSDLPNDLLTDIARRLKRLEDYTSFRSVSKSLHAAAKEDYFEGLRLRQHTPYMMLPVREGNDDTREFYSLVENESIVASVKVPNFKRKKCLESLGWLLVSKEDGSSSLLDPLSGTEIPLPHQNTFPEYDRYVMEGDIFFEKMLLSSKPNETSDFVLMVIGGCIRELAFWRLGDEAWTKIYKRSGAYTDVVHYIGGIFYAFCHPGVVWVFNLSGSDNQIEGRIVVNFIPVNVIPHSVDDYSEIVGYNRIYLLKTIDDSLLLITRSSPPLGVAVDISYITTKIQVYDLDVVKGSEIQIWLCSLVTTPRPLWMLHDLLELLKPIIFTSRTIIGHFMAVKDEDYAVAMTVVCIILQRELSSRFILESRCSANFLHLSGLLCHFNAVYRLPFTHCGRHI